MISFLQILTFNTIYLKDEIVESAIEGEQNE